MRAECHNILIPDDEFFDAPSAGGQGVVVAHRNQHVAATDAEALALDCIALEQLKLIVHVLLRESMLLRLTNSEAVKIAKKTREKAMPLMVATDLVNKLMSAVASSTAVIEAMPKGISYSYAEIDGHLPAALAFVLEAEHQHGQAFEGEAPDHAERVSLAEGVDIAAAGQNGENLKADDQIDDAITGAVPRCGNGTSRRGRDLRRRG